MPKNVLTAAFAACLFLLVLSAKWATFDRFGSPMPDWDQWDAEALETYVPWFTRDHFLTHLFHPHNEHRVVLTKLQNLALVLLNGQWDSRLEAVTNAALHAALATAFWLLAVRFLATPPRAPGHAPHSSRPAPLASRLSPLAFRLSPFVSSLLFLLAFALFGLPLAWQNVLGGFHSQQYWLVGLSFAAIVTLPFVRSWSPAWWIGALAAILAFGSMGSGFLAAAAVVIVLAWRLLARETTVRATWPALVVSFALIAVGVLTRHEVPWHAEMKAKTVHDFVFSIVHSLEWPWRDRDWAALVLWLPWLLVATHVAREGWNRFRHPTATVRHETDPASAHAPQAITALGGWVLLQLAATAYARGAGADYPASRYMDTLTFAAMANALALAWLLVEHFPRTFARRLALVVVAVGWLGTLSLGLYNLLAHTVRWELLDAKKYYIKAEGHMRRYLATNDPKQLAYPEIPFPSADGLVERLAQPTLRVLMPAPIRTPLALKPAAAARNETGFAANTAIDADIVNPPRHGLSAVTPPLDYTTTWGTFGSESGNTAAPLTWTSEPLRATLGGWLKFEIAGDLGPAATDLSLTLRDPQSGSFLATVRPTRRPGDTWRSAYVRAPRGPFVVTASDASPTQWFAFSPPVEMAPLSVWAWQATKHALLIFYGATAATLALALLALLGRRRPPSQADFPAARAASS